MTENFISAVLDHKSDQVYVWTRDDENIEIRHLRRFKCPYYFYVEDDEGEFQSLFPKHKPLRKKTFNDKWAFREEVKKLDKIQKFESDVSPLDKVLMKEFYQKPKPHINFAFFDIEVDYDSEIGPSLPSNPYAPICAITIYKQWKDEFITIAVPPKDYAGDFQKEFSERYTDIQSNCTIVDNEKELLRLTLDEIEDIDLLSGWYSEFYDVPYLVKRTEIVLGKTAMKRWCFDLAPAPIYKEVETFGTQHLVVKLQGRVHLDYIDLFQKFTFEGRSSWALDAIASEELGTKKLEYDGTLEEFYHRDFVGYVKYNIYDVSILKQLDEKFSFIALANQLAHANTVQMESVLGTVKMVETGIINYIHNVLNKVLPDREMKPDHGKVEGAIVMTPKIGLHEWIGSVDLTSLYPTTIRSLNMSPETLIGQFTQYETDWRGIWNQDNNIHILELEDGETFEGTGKEWNEILRNKGWAISGYGTVFNQKISGAIADVLTLWFAERKRYQGEKKKWGSEIDKLKSTLGRELTEEELRELDNNRE